jgi:hypothetical protein
VYLPTVPQSLMHVPLRVPPGGTWGAEGAQSSGTSGRSGEGGGNYLLLSDNAYEDYMYPTCTQCASILVDRYALPRVDCCTRYYVCIYLVTVGLPCAPLCSPLCSLSWITANVHSKPTFSLAGVSRVSRLGPCRSPRVRVRARAHGKVHGADPVRTTGLLYILTWSTVLPSFTLVTRHSSLVARHARHSSPRDMYK